MLKVCRWAGLTVSTILGLALIVGVQPGAALAQSTATPTPVSGGLIAFQSTRDKRTEIWTMHTDGSNPLRLTNTPNKSNHDLAWSPDGTHILFVRSESDASKPQLWIMSNDGKNQHMLLDQAEAPQWSPDSKQIAYQKMTPDRSNSEIDVMDADGQNARALVTSQAMNAVEPQMDGYFLPDSVAWAPDGKRIAFEQSLGGMMKYAIYDVNSDGSGLHKVVNDGGGGDCSWSPDGKYLLGASAGAGKIFTVDMQTSAFAVHSLSVGEDFDYQPRWSPDGKHIAFISSTAGDNGQNSLYIMDSDGSHRRQVTSGIAVTALRWSPDGSELAFGSAAGGNNSQLYVVSVAGGKPQRLSDGNGDDNAFQWQP
ncbi:MAG TPA: hypothetical protein VKQ72_14125 [Aggregatilineales bacterium]|nr:hypothetical protein [Aggregatilineales bacterium]